MRKNVSLIFVSLIMSFWFQGLGQAGGVWCISSKEDLLAIGDHPERYGDYFYMTRDIDLSGEVFDRALIASEGRPGDFDPNSFSGVFNGNGFKITGLKIEGGDNDYVGLFGFLDGGEIKNLGMEGCDIEGRNCVGGLLGSSQYYNQTRIENCYFQGKVTGEDSVGGLAGVLGDLGSSISGCYVDGYIYGYGDGIGGLVGSNCGDIYESYFKGGVFGGDNVGGLAGEISAKGVVYISECYAEALIAGSNRVGGLAGMCFMGDNIINCYSKCEIYGDEVGGLVGEHAFYGNISNCYSGSNIHSSGFLVGGLVSVNNGGDISNSFWDKEILQNPLIGSVGYSSSGEITNVAGLTSEQMKQESTFVAAGWDFVFTWGIDENNSYPYLIYKDRPEADISMDGKVDYSDFTILSLAWGSEPGYHNWNEDCDISEPWDVIDYRDLAKLSEKWLCN